VKRPSSLWLRPIAIRSDEMRRYEMSNMNAPLHHTNGIGPNHIIPYTRCGKKKYPLLQTLYCESPAISALGTAQKFTYFKMTRTSFLLAEISPSYCQKRNSVSPRFAMFQRKLSTMSQNRSDWNAPILCSVSSKFTTRSVFLTDERHK